MSIVTKESNPELYNALFEDATIEDAKKVMQNMFNDIKPEQFEELKKQALENVKKNNMSAKEMFEKLGYACDESCDGFLYSKWVEKKNKYGDLTDYEIQIHIEKSPFTFMKTITEEVFNPNKPTEITLEELQAINKQVEELGWNK